MCVYQEHKSWRLYRFLQNLCFSYCYILKAQNGHGYYFLTKAIQKEFCTLYFLVLTDSQNETLFLQNLVYRLVHSSMFTVYVFNMPLKHSSMGPKSILANSLVSKRYGYKNYYKYQTYSSLALQISQNNLQGRKVE